MLDADRLASIQKTRKLALAAFATAGMLLIIFSEPTWSHFTRRVIEAVGLLFISICIVGRTLCAAYISGRKNAAIVDAGPYSVCRNPLYMFSLVGVIGIGLVTGSLALTTIFGSTIWLVQRFVVDKEELFLRAEHGQLYDDYLHKVPRFWPDFALWQSDGQILVSTKGVLSTFADASLLLLAIPVVEVLELLKAERVVPVLFGLP